MTATPVEASAVRNGNVYRVEMAAKALANCSPSVVNWISPATPA